MEYGFTDIVDIYELHELVKVFDLATSLSFSIKDANGTVITNKKINGKSSDICSELMEEKKCNKRIKSAIFSGNKKRDCYEYRFNCGFLKIEIPVLFEHVHLATAVFDNLAQTKNGPDVNLNPEDCKYFNESYHCSINDDIITALSMEDIRKKIDSFCILLDLLVSRGIRDLQVRKYESFLVESKNDTISAGTKSNFSKDQTFLQMSLFSHELRTPLSIVKGYNELLYDGCLGSLDNGQKAALDKSLCSINRLERLVDSILYIGMEHCNDHYYDCNPLNILDVIESSLIDVRKSLEAKNISLQLSFPEQVPVIHGDGRKLSKAIVHLLDNAIKFSPAGSSIFLSVIEKDNCLSLSIKDAGIGIIEEHLACIFDSFYQGDTSLTRKYPGVGLGLNICQRIVKKHEGSIRVESKVNEGSTFHIDLPIKEQVKDFVSL